MAESWSAQSDDDLTDDQRRIREAFTRRRGYWADDWQMILELAPEVMEAYTDISAHPAEHGTLDAKTREFMFITTTAVVTHIHPIGIHNHGRQALAAGATPQELVSLLALVAGIGVRGYLMTAEVLEEVAPGSTRGILADEQEIARLQEEWERVFGVWDPSVEAGLRADPAWFSAFLRWAAAPRIAGVLDARTVALVSICANATVTHLDRATLAREIRAALAIGVDPREILEVVELTAGVSVHSLTVGVPILVDLFAGATELARH